MRIFMRRLQYDWGSWLAVAFIALLPFNRLAEIPLSIFAVSLAFLARAPEHRARIRSAARFVLPLFLCCWIPMVLSSFDAVLPQKSWMQSAAALRFLAAALALSVLLQAPSARERLLRWTAWLLLFWALDAFVQLFFGHDLFGIPMHPDRLNALFYERYQFFGPTLAFLAPLVLEHARRRWRPWAWELTFALLLGAVLIAGMRAGWLAMGLVLATYMILMLKHENRELRRALLTIPALALVVLVFTFFASPLLQERLDVTRAFTFGSEQAAGPAADAPVDQSAMERIPIFRAALLMYRDHPVNGVGVRGYPYAYVDYAEPGDIHVAKSDGRYAASSRAQHRPRGHGRYRHHRPGWPALAFVFAFRHGRRVTPGERRDAFPLRWPCS
jgi:O-antigen ligase